MKVNAGVRARRQYELIRGKQSDSSFYKKINRVKKMKIPLGIGVGKPF